MSKKFLRRDWSRYKRLGKGRKKKQKWRKPKGRHNKIREKMKGYARKVEVGYKKPEKERGRINGFIPRIVRNLKEIKKGTSRTDVILIAKVGKRKRKEIEEAAKRLNIKILNKMNKR